MIRSGLKLLQMYAVMSGLLLTYYGYIYNDIILLITGIVIVYRDSVLLFRKEKCEPTDKPVYDLSVRSGNKLIQLLGTMVGLYIVYKYGSSDILLFGIGLLALFGDGYLFLIEGHKICRLEDLNIFIQ